MEAKRERTPSGAFAEFEDPGQLRISLAYKQEASRGLASASLHLGGSNRQSVSIGSVMTASNGCSFCNSTSRIVSSAASLPREVGRMLLHSAYAVSL